MCVGVNEHSNITKDILKNRFFQLTVLVFTGL